MERRQPRRYTAFHLTRLLVLLSEFLAQHRPTCWIIAGPNGAGKTTFALEYLPKVAGVDSFINADMIAGGLSPLSPNRERLNAGRLFRERIRAAVRAYASFGFETTLAGLSQRSLVTELAANHWRVELIYLALPNPETARQRVTERVAHGGHDIPRTDIERRFHRGLYNLFYEFAPLVTRTRCIDNSSTESRLVFEQASNQQHVYLPDLFAKLQEQAWR